jgi:hypothetical protein
VYLFHHYNENNLDVSFNTEIDMLRSSALKYRQAGVPGEHRHGHVLKDYAALMDWISTLLTRTNLTDEATTSSIPSCYQSIYQYLLEEK